MCDRSCIEELVNAAKAVLHCGCKEPCYNDWRDRAFRCLSELFGPNHEYAGFFKDWDPSPTVGTLVAGSLILGAAGDRLGKACNR